MNIILGITFLLVIPFYIWYLVNLCKHTSKLYKPDIWWEEEPTYIMLLGIHILFIGFLIGFAVHLFTL